MNKFQKPDFDFKNEFIKLKKKYNFMLFAWGKEWTRYDIVHDVMKGKIKILKHALFTSSIVNIIFLLKLL